MATGQQRGTRGFEPARELLVAAVTLAVAVFVAACGSSGATPANSAASSGPVASAPLVGNGANLPLPGDAPAVVRGLPSVFSCGAETSDENNEGNESEASQGDWDPGAGCLVQAFERNVPAQYVVADGDQDAGGRYSIYRVVGDGTLLVYVRQAPSFATPAGWTRLVCHGVTLTDEGITESGCSNPEPIS